MIEINNVTKKYKSKIILNNISLTINKNEKVAIIGLNGSGKTTIAELILKVYKPTTGTINYDIKNVRRNAVFQDASFDSELNLNQLINFYSSSFEIKSDNKKLLSDFGLSKLIKNRFSTLSGGQKQKFKFLISLLNKPNLLLIDELTNFLDYIWKVKIVSLVKSYLAKNDCTLLFVTHDINEIVELCDRLILLNEGAIVKDIKVVNYSQIKNIIDEEVLRNDIDM